MVNRIVFLLIFLCFTGLCPLVDSTAMAQGSCPASTTCPKPTLLMATKPAGVYCQVINNPQKVNYYLLKATAKSCDCKFTVPSNGPFKMDCSTFGSTCYTAPNSQGACYGEMTVQKECPGCSEIELNNKRTIPFKLAGDNDLCNKWMETKCSQICATAKPPEPAVASIQCVGTKPLATPVPTPKQNTSTPQPKTPTPQPNTTNTQNIKNVYLTVDLIGGKGVGLVDIQVVTLPKNATISCGPTCVSFAPTQKVILTATPPTGFYFQKWGSGGVNPCVDSNTSTVCEMLVAADKNVTALFGQSYTVNWLTDDPKKGKVPFPTSPAGIPGLTCGSNCKVYGENDVIKFNPEPSSGWKFGSWSGDCTSTIGETCVVDIAKYPQRKNITIVPNFVSTATPTPAPKTTTSPTPGQQYSYSELTVSPGAAVTVTTAKANISCLKQPTDPKASCYRIRLNDKVTLTALPSMPGMPEKTFAYYALDQYNSTSDSKYSFNITSNTYVVANYVAKPTTPQQCTGGKEITTAGPQYGNCECNDGNGKTCIIIPAVKAGLTCANICKGQSCCK